MDFARAVGAKLEDTAEVTVWDEGVFGLGESYLESLTAALSRFDFAVLVLTPDDPVEYRGAAGLAPRDNVLFELGLFMGKLGRGRTFVLHPADPQFKIPSDLLGISTTKYYWPREDKNYEAAVGSACHKIREKIRSLGLLNRNSDAQVGAGLDLRRVKESHGIIWTMVSGCEIRVVTGRIEEYPIDSDTVMVLPCNEYFDAAPTILRVHWGHT
jgi:hypothetical protein